MQRGPARILARPLHAAPFLIPPTFRPAPRVVPSTPTRSPPNNELVTSFIDFMALVKDDLHDHPALHIPSYPKIAENGIVSLVDRAQFDEALIIYRRILDDGFLPLPSTDALFLAITMKVSGAPGAAQLGAFKKILSYSTFTERHVLQLLDHLQDLNIPAKRAVEMVELFMDVKGAGYEPSREVVLRLVGLQSKAGDYDLVPRLIARYGLQADREIKAQPYPHLLQSAPMDDSRIDDWIMDAMREEDENVPVHIVVFNALIQRQRHLKGLRQAFAYYNVLMSLTATTDLKPNAFTYKSLFDLLAHQYKNNYRPNHSRLEQEQAHAVLKPRELFYQMMAIWFNWRVHPPASSDPYMRQTQMDNDSQVLGVAFRAFLYVEDYAAARVTLEMFGTLGLGVQDREYYTLLRYMARKVYYDVIVSRKKHIPPIFARHMLGAFHSTKILARDPDVTYHWIMEHLLRQHTAGAKEGNGRIPTLNAILAFDVRRRRLRSRLKPDENIDQWPLFNMIHRAMQMASSTTPEPLGDMWRKRRVREARYEMIPPWKRYWSWRHGEEYP